MSVNESPAEAGRSGEGRPDSALRRVTLEIERHAASAGWDLTPRLFALVPTAQLVRSEPALAEQLRVDLDADPDGLTSVEQESLPAHETLEDVLPRIAWPETVAGCAAVLERVMLPPHAETELPADPAEMLRFVAEHPERSEVRIVAAVTRSGERHSVVRGRHPDDAPLLEGPDLVPGLLTHLSDTLE